MKLRLFRHATFHLVLDGKVILVDPVLSPAEGMTPIDNSPNQRRNPLVDLPADITEVMAADCLLITHTHRDHFDSFAGEYLPKNIPIFCQVEDVDKLEKLGFTKVQALQSPVNWEGVEFERTGGQHGTGEIGRMMAPVSGYVVKAPGEPTVYVAGDTIWCQEAAEAIKTHRPEVIVLYGGEARFNEGDPITMGKRDIYQVCQNAPDAKIVVLHMEAINHCLLTRPELNSFLKQEGLSDRVAVPADGQWLEY